MAENMYFPPCPECEGLGYRPWVDPHIGDPHSCWYCSGYGVDRFNPVPVSEDSDVATIGDKYAARRS